MLDPERENVQLPRAKSFDSLLQTVFTVSYNTSNAQILKFLNNHVVFIL